MTQEIRPLLWHVVPMDIHGWSIHDAEGREIVANIYHEETAIQIAREHNSHEEYSRLLNASLSLLSDARDSFGFSVTGLKRIEAHIADINANAKSIAEQRAWLTKFANSETT